MAHLFGKISRFRFNLPQRIAAAMLTIFLAQGLWVASRQTLSENDYQYARCGRETWEGSPLLTPGSTSCGKIYDGIAAYRLAGLPFTLNLLAERAADRFRAPEDRVIVSQSAPSPWELRHQMTHMLLWLRLPFLLTGCALGGCLWWISRRLFGNLGGYTALAFYCFSPAILGACLVPGPEVLAALGVYGGIYTLIGVAHAMQGPRRKWRPRIVLLTVILSIASAAHLAALAVAVLLGLTFMLWIAEGRRGPILPVVSIATTGSVLVLFAWYGFSASAFRCIFRCPAGFLWLSADPARRYFLSLPNAGVTVATAAAMVFYLASRRSRYFGNTAPLIGAVLLVLLIMTGAPGSPWLWSLPFLFTFIAGLFADVYEGPHRRLAIAAGAALVLLQALLCLFHLPALV
jgi:hypothetical protein